MGTGVPIVGTYVQNLKTGFGELKKWWQALSNVRRLANVSP